MTERIPQPLIQHEFSVRVPTHLLPGFYRQMTGCTPPNAFSILRTPPYILYDHDLFGDNRYKGVELAASITGIHNENWNPNRRVINHYVRSPLIIGALHACVGGVSRRDDLHLDLCHDDETTRQAIAATLEVAKNLVKTLPSFVVFHTGVYDIRYKEEAFTALITNLRFATKILDPHQILLIENDFTDPNQSKLCTLGHFEDLQRIINTIDSPNVKICFDWGHASMTAYKLFREGELTQEELDTFTYHERFIHALNRNICYAHIHYNPRHQEDAEIYAAKDPLYPSNWSKSGGDLHMPLNKIPPQFIPSFTRTLQLLWTETSIPEYLKFQLELTRERIAGIIPFNTHGATTTDALESLKIVEAAFNNYSEYLHDT